MVQPVDSARVNITINTIAFIGIGEHIIDNLTP